MAYASRELTDAETRYAQIEKELLAIVYSCEKFHQYTYGNKVRVLSDHKPLESILKKPLANTPRRLQGMAMRLQRYDIEIEYLQGKKMFLADTLSRAYLQTSLTNSPQDEIEQINMTEYLPISSDRLAEIRMATEADDTSKELKRIIFNGWLTVTDGIILKGDRVVVPQSMRKTLKEKLHSSHLGITGCVRRGRECLYWPNMAHDIKDFISKCPVCREMESGNVKETLMPHDIPDRPWSKVGSDLFSLAGINRDRQDYLITVDYFSSFYEVDRLPDTTASTVIGKLKQHFARFGLPETVPPVCL